VPVGVKEVERVVDESEDDEIANEHNGNALESDYHQ
jgi:hypothetical protein